MIKTRKYILFLLLSVLNIACDKNADSKYFRGEVLDIVSNDNDIYEVNLDTLVLHGSNYGYPAVYDSLLIFLNPKLNGYFYQIFNVDTKEEIGLFCRKGNGPGEMLALAPIYQFYKEDNELKSLIFAPNESKLYVWNISRSIDEQTTILEQETDYKWREENKYICYNHVFRLASDTLLAELRSASLNNGEITLPKYQKRTIATNKPQTTYTPYKKVINNENAIAIPETFFYSYDALKPDGTKLAQAMYFLPQLNILDLSNNTVKGYRVESTKGFSVFEKEKGVLNKYFLGLQSDNNHIYAAYAEGEELSEETLNHLPSMLYVFDWDGQLLKKIRLNIGIQEMALDSVRRILYITNFYSDDVFCLHLRF